jgi:hypothetical protein
MGDHGELLARIEDIRKRAAREPLDVDISDMSDEWCSGFLAGQVQALAVVFEDWSLDLAATLRAALATQPEPDERSLADDLADVLARTVVGWESVIGHDLAQAPEVQRVMARYRSARAAAGSVTPEEDTDG